MLALVHGIAHIYLGYVLQLPVLQSCNGDVLSCKIIVIGVVAQGTIWIIELDHFHAFLLQGVFDALLAHARHLVVHFQGRSCRQHHIGTLVFFVPYYHHKLLLAVGMLGYLISHKVMLGHLRLHLVCLLLVLQGRIFYFLATLRLADNAQCIVHITLYGIYQAWIFLQFAVPVVHQSHVLLGNLG